LLSFEQERVYITRVQAQRQGLHDTEAEEHLVKSNIGWVTVLARKLRGHGVEEEDLIQEGCIALLKAVKKFDLTTSYRLSSYATWDIRRAMQRCIENTGLLLRLPTYLHEAMRYERYEQYTDLHERFTQEQVRVTRRAMAPVRSLERQLDPTEQDDFTLKDILEAKDDETETVALHAVQRDELKAVLRQVLPTRERQMLALRFGLVDGYEYPLEEIGEEFQVTRERVRQICASALKKLQASPLAAKLKEADE